MNIEGIKNALDYPGQTIKDSFLYTHNRVYKIDLDIQDINNSDIHVNDKVIKYGELVGFSNCAYVISYGANGALKYLGSKFEEVDVNIPVIYFELHGYDIVYSNYICSDGTIPSTIVKSEGSSVKIYISPLPESDIEILNETEAIGVDYELRKLEGTKLSFLTTNDVYYYDCTHGAVKIDGKLYSCDSIDGSNRLGAVISQYEILKLACEHIFSESDIYKFIDNNISDDLSRAINNKIMENN